MKIMVHGLWHLGCVTAACLAEAGHQVIGLDSDDQVVADLQRGQPPLHEPGLEQVISRNLAIGRLEFTTDPHQAIASAELIWVTFDTPVIGQDEADVAFVRHQIDVLAPLLKDNTLVLVSSQVPVGFTRTLELSWPHLHFAYSPENLRLGKALECFRNPDRVVMGIRRPEDRPRLFPLFEFQRVEWMSVESAEMTKHALNAFLATSVTFINELARLCETVGANAKEVERGLKSEIRIGPKAYLSPGPAFAGGTLARDLKFLIGMGNRCRKPTPLFQGVLASNNLHKDWMIQSVQGQRPDHPNPVAAVLGLTYKPGTSTLRRSSSVELCQKLFALGWTVQAHDPMIRSLPAELRSGVNLCESMDQVLQNADVAVLATPWPEYKSIQGDWVVKHMRRPVVIDPHHFLADNLGGDPRVIYRATGLPRVNDYLAGELVRRAGTIPSKLAG